MHRQALDPTTTPCVTLTWVSDERGDMLIEEPVGTVERYYPKVDAASVRIEEGGLKLGDTIHFKGPSGEYEERITSMELDHEKIRVAREGQEVGIEVPVPIEPGSQVLLVRDPYREAKADVLDQVFEAG